MRAKAFAVTLIVFVVGGRAASVPAQSLAEVARQEEARRKTIKQPSKVLTNKDLGSVPATTPPPVTDAKAAGGAAASAESANDGDKDKKGSDQKAGELPKNQAGWAARAKELQAQLDRDQTYADALQSRINALTADFANRADPAQRAVIGNDRQKALDELNRLKKQIEDDKKAITDLQEDARRAGIPAGWLR